MDFFFRYVKLEGWEINSLLDFDTCDYHIENQIFFLWVNFFPAICVILNVFVYFSFSNVCEIDVFYDRHVGIFPLQQSTSYWKRGHLWFDYFFRICIELIFSHVKFYLNLNFRVELIVLKSFCTVEDSVGLLCPATTEVRHCEYDFGE